MVDNRVIGAEWVGSEFVIRIADAPNNDYVVDCDAMIIALNQRRMFPRTWDSCVLLGRRRR